MGAGREAGPAREAEPSEVAEPSEWLGVGGGWVGPGGGPGGGAAPGAGSGAERADRPRSPACPAPHVAAPSATISFGSANVVTLAPYLEVRSRCTIGMRLLPPVRWMASRSELFTPAAVMVRSSSSTEACTSGSTSASNSARVTTSASSDSGIATRVVG